LFSTQLFKIAITCLWLFFYFSVAYIPVTLPEHVKPIWLNIAGMMRIGLLSDTHGFLHDAVFRHLEACDEIWHAGDFGNAAVAEALKSFKPLKGVYGNINGYDVRSLYPQKLSWICQEVSVFMTHIGRYPGRY
jgi:hypothetical protein